MSKPKCIEKCPDRIPASNPDNPFMYCSNPDIVEKYGAEPQCYIITDGMDDIKCPYGFKTGQVKLTDF